MKIVIVLVFLCLSTLSNAEYTVAIDKSYVELTNIDKDLKEAYKRIGIDAHMVYLPGERAMQRSISGKYDALDVRFLNPQFLLHLIPVNEPIYFKQDIHAYAITPFPLIEDVSELSSYILGFPRGLQYRKKLTDQNPEFNVFIAPDYKMLSDALFKNRAELIIIPEGFLNYIFTKEQLNEVYQVTIDPLETLEAYHHIHESNAHLEEKLRKVIKQMKSEGYFSARPEKD